MLPRDSANSISTGTLTTPNVDWSKTFEQWEASNMSQAAFCKENQIDWGNNVSDLVSAKTTTPTILN